MIKKLLVVLTIVSVLSLASGCLTQNSEKPANLTKEEKQKLIKQVSVAFVDRYPNEQGLVKIFGEITNSSNRYVISATVRASDIPAKNKTAVKFGSIVVKDIEPGVTKTFEITTGKGIGEVNSDNVIVEIVDAQFR